MGLNDSADLALALAVCKDVQREADEIFARFDVKSKEHLKLLMAAKALRARGLFQAVVSLAEQNLTSPASALIRCLMELKFVVLALASDPAFVADLVETDNSQRARAMRNLSRLPEEHRAANVRPDEIRAWLEHLGAPGRGPTVAEWAKRAACLDEYNLAYLLLSGDVHPALRGVEAHLLLDGQGEPRSLFALPDLGELPFRLMHACDCYLRILFAQPEGSLDVEARDAIQRLNADARKMDINQRVLAESESRVQISETQKFGPRGLPSEGT